MIKIDRLGEGALVFFFFLAWLLNFKFSIFLLPFCFVLLTSTPFKLDTSDNLPVGPRGT